MLNIVKIIKQNKFDKFKKKADFLNKAVVKYRKMKSELSDTYKEIKLKTDLENVKKIPRKIKEDQFSRTNAFSVRIKGKKYRLMTPSPKEVNKHWKLIYFNFDFILAKINMII